MCSELSPDAPPLTARRQASTPPPCTDCFAPRYTALNGCPRCGGSVLTYGIRSCLQCGWSGPTHTPTRDELAVAERERLIYRAADAAQLARHEERIAAAVDLWDRGYSLVSIAAQIGPVA